jgi:nitrogen fixation NifU-like protein
MSEIGYSKKVLDHFMNPRNVGTLESPDGYGKVGNPVCGDLMEMFIRVKEEKIDEITFRTFGCTAAIATSSMTTEMARALPRTERGHFPKPDNGLLDGLTSQIYITQCIAPSKSQPQHGAVFLEQAIFCLPFLKNTL